MEISNYAKLCQTMGQGPLLKLFFFHFIFCQMANQLPQYYLLNNPLLPHHFIIDLLHVLD